MLKSFFLLALHLENSVARAIPESVSQSHGMEQPAQLAGDRHTETVPDRLDGKFSATAKRIPLSRSSYCWIKESRLVKKWHEVSIRILGGFGGPVQSAGLGVKTNEYSQRSSSPHHLDQSQRQRSSRGVQPCFTSSSQVMLISKLS